MIDLAKQKMFHIGFGFWLIEKDTALFSLVLCGSVWLEWVWFGLVGVVWFAWFYCFFCLF
jgi:hypothetical protein